MHAPYIVFKETKKKCQFSPLDRSCFFFERLSVESPSDLESSFSPDSCKPINNRRRKNKKGSGRKATKVRKKVEKYTEEVGVVL